MRIFFALSMVNYDKPFERQNLEKIKNIHGDSYEIISASEINKRILDSDKKKGFRYIEENYFFKEIDKSDIVIGTYNAISRQFTIGVIVEMEYALMKGKRVFEMDLYNVYRSENLLELSIESGIGRHYSDIAYKIPDIEVVRIKDKYKDEIKERWWL